MSENQENNQNIQPTPSVVSQENINPAPNPQPNYNNTQNYQQNMNYSNMQTNTIPNEYKPLSPWAYVGYNLLFSLPLVGFIMMIVFAFDSSNINRRNYARSFFCAMLIGLIVAVVILVIVFGIAGLSFTAFNASSTSSSLMH